MIRFFFLNEDGDPEEFTDRVNLAESRVVFTSQAEQGSVGSSTIIVDDPDGDWYVRGHRWIYALEDAADFQMLHWGYVGEKDVKRMAPYVGRSAEWHVTVTDINTLLGRRIMVGSDCDRPAETDVERMQWLTGTTEQSFINDNVTYLSTSGPVDMDPADYRYQYATQIYDDCSQASGKNWYLLPYFDDPDWKTAIWYDVGGSSAYSSAIRISNDLADVDSETTFYASLSTNLNQSPSRVYSGVAMPFDGGTQYSQLASTITNFAARDTSAPQVNVKTYTKAQARALRYLHTINTEEDVIDTSILVPPEQVNDVLVGHRIEAKYTHLRGYHDFSWMRVLKKTTTFLTPWEYGIDLTLSAQPDVDTPFPVPGDTVDGYACTVNGYAVPWCVGDGTTLSAGPIGSDNVGVSSDATVLLYGEATYRFVYNVVHAHGGSVIGDNNLGVTVGPSPLDYGTGGDGHGTRVNMGSEYFGTALYNRTIDATMNALVDDCVPLWVYEGAGYFSLNVVGATATCDVYYVSGPDPRFVDLLPCPDPDWDPFA